MNGWIENKVLSSRKHYLKELAIFSVKGQIGNIFSSGGHIVSISIIQSSHCNKSSHRHSVNEWMWLFL